MVRRRRGRSKRRRRGGGGGTLKYSHIGESFPPMSWTYSTVSLNAPLSKFREPGEFDSMNPEV